MSFYCTIDGEISYQDDASYQEAIDLLRRGHWLNDKDQFVDEAGAYFVEESTVDRDAKTITIPRGLYRNLGAHLNTLQKGSVSSFIVWGTTDGQYQGGVIQDGVETLTDLEAWAKEPEQVEELGEWIDECEFVNDVVELFMDTNT
jgi:hypothetical protein